MGIAVSGTMGAEESHRMGEGLGCTEWKEMSQSLRALIGYIRWYSSPISAAWMLGVGH